MKKKNIIKVGQFFKNKAGEIFILAQVDCSKCALIVIRCPPISVGNRQYDPINVEDIFDITKGEFEKMCGSEALKKVNVKITEKKK